MKSLNCFILYFAFFSICMGIISCGVKSLPVTYPEKVIDSYLDSYSTQTQKSSNLLNKTSNDGQELTPLSVSAKKSNH